VVKRPTVPHDGTEGLVILGKTNTLEFGVLTRTEPCPFSPSRSLGFAHIPIVGRYRAQLDYKNLAPQNVDVCLSRGSYAGCY